MDNIIQQVSSAQRILKYTYGIVPIVAGLDKFTNLLVNWKDYLGAGISRALPMSEATFMSIVGIIEIIAGAFVLFNPRKGAYIVTAWLVLISLTLIASGHYLDIAVRDLVMAVGAFVLAKLSNVTALQAAK